MNNLILLTGEFPFGKGEPFLESEIQYLAKSFHRVFIISNCSGNTQTRQLPEKCKVFQYTQTPARASAALNIFRKEVREELSFVSKIYRLRLTPLILKTALMSYSNAILFNQYLRKIIEEERILRENLFVYSYWLNDLTLGAAFLKKDSDETKVFSRAHGWDVYFERHPSNYLPYRKLLVEKMDSIFFISENGKEYFNKKVECPKEKLKVSRLGTINSVQPDFNIPGEFTIISCSSLIPLKRVHLLIEALSLIENIKLTWFHVGGGELKNELKTLAKNKLDGKLNIRYQFLGQTTNAELLLFYRNTPASVFVNVSEFEGLPVSIMEAMSFGIPIIATDVGGVGEIVKDRLNGILLEKQSTIGEIADAIKFFLSLKKEEITTYRSNAYSTWNNNYNAEKNYPDFVKRVLSLS